LTTQLLPSPITPFNRIKKKCIHCTQSKPKNKVSTTSRLPSDAQYRCSYWPLGIPFTTVR